MDRQASSESAFERIGNAFGSSGVERERISKLRRRIWIDGRRARAHFSIPEKHLARQAPSASAFESVRKAFGSTNVERKRISAIPKCIWDDRRRAGAHLSVSNAHRKPIGGSPISVEKTSTFCVSLTPEGLAFDDPMEPLRQARIGFGSTKIVLLAPEQFMKNVWHCTRNGFGARKPPAEPSPGQKVLYLSSEMHQGAETTVFVVPENEKALELRVSSSQNSHRSNVGFLDVWEENSA